MDKLHGESHDPPGTGELMIELKYSVASGSQALLSPPPWGCTGITPGQMPTADTALQPGAGMDTAVFASVLLTDPHPPVPTRPSIPALCSGTHTKLASTQRQSRSGSRPILAPGLTSSGGQWPEHGLLWKGDSHGPECLLRVREQGGAEAVRGQEAGLGKPRGSRERY